MEVKSIIGIDIGGTNFRIGAINTDGSMHTLKIVRSRFIGEGNKPLPAIADMINKYLEEQNISRENVLYVSIGVPGTVDKDGKRAISVPNIMNEKGEHILDNLNISDEISEIISIPVSVNKDVNNLLAYDVYTQGMEKENIVVGCYIGTGFGGSIRINGKFLSGKNGVANEIGHIPFYKGEDYCTCGKKACAECYASGRVLQNIRTEHFPDVYIGDLFVDNSNHPALVDFIYACSLPIATQVNIFDPDCVIIGGGVVEMAGFPKQKLLDEVLKNTRSPIPAQTLNIRYAKQSDNKGVVGAALNIIMDKNVEVANNFRETLMQNENI